MRAVIAIREEAGHTEATYAPPIPAWGPRVLAAALAGGLALGLAASVVLIALDRAAGWPFSTLLLLLSGAGAVLIYALAWLTTRPVIAVCVSVDVLAGRVTVAQGGNLSDPYTLALDDVVGFRLIRPTERRARECLLVLDTVEDGPLTLFHARHPCHVRRTRLPEYCDRLNVILEAAGTLLETLQSPPPLSPHLAPPPPTARDTWPLLDVLPEWSEDDQ